MTVSALDLATTGLPGVTASPHADGGGLPLFLHPTDSRLAEDGRYFQDWFRANRQAIEELTVQAGALVLRGFALRDTADFAGVAAHFPSLDTGYAGGATPRQALAEKVFESTRLPAAHKLPLHQEMSYLPSYPTMVAFFSRVPAETGGETTIGDMRKFTARLPPHVWQAVKARGVRYERNYRDPAWSSGSEILDTYHRPWPEALGVSTPAEAEARCGEMGMAYEWRSNGSLTLRFANPGWIAHPKTGQELWFNQVHAQNFTRESIGAERHGLYEQYYGSDTPLPVNTAYGDGGRIEPADISALHALLDELTVGFPWRQGDLMFLDNFNVAHGRNPYTGARDTQVALIA